MITSAEHAIAVQRRRRQAGKPGRAKAVRRWFGRVYGRGVEAHASDSLPPGLKDLLAADFSGCRSFEETHPCHT